MKKPLLFPFFNIENLSLFGWKGCICVLLFLFSFEKSYAQLPLQNIACTGCSTTASTGYATAAGASTGTGAGATSYSLGTNAVSVQCATVTSDVNGTVGIINAIIATTGTCITNTSASRKGSLYLASGVNCTGTEIQAIRKGTNSSTFNNEYVGLTPNTNYIFVFKTTIDATCGAGAYTSSSIRFYGGVTPQFSFNCGTASTTGTFIADGSSHSGNLIVPITGASAGSATFNVSGTGFSGTLTATLTPGQTSVTIPITYDGTGSAGSRTLTVTSPTGGGLCTKSVVILDGTDSDSDGIVDIFDLDDDNDGILDTVENACGLTQAWTSPSAGVWQTNISANLKVKITFTGAWAAATSIANFARNCTDATYTSDFKPLSNTNKPALQFQLNNGATGATLKVEYLDGSNQPVTVNNPRMHLGGLGGSYGTGFIGASDWTLTSGGTHTALSLDATDFGATSTTIFHPRLFAAGSGVNDCATGEGSATMQINGLHNSFTYTLDMNGATNDQMVVMFEACNPIDIDGDGIANYLDLDSDGDGCSDALEGGANLATSNLVTSTMPGGNTGGTYTGTSTSSVNQNLGNIVGSTATTLGVPTVAGAGQAMGNSENGAVKSPNCITCNAGTTAPTLTVTTKSNVCPTTTADISSLVSSTCPIGSSLEWHTVSTGLSAANKVGSPTMVGAGTYFPTCFDVTNNCYSPTPTTGVTVTITTCLSITQPATQTSLQNVAKSGTVSADVTITGGVGAIIYSNGSSDPACVAPSGATALSSPLTINSSTGQYSYTTPSTVGSYYFCVKVCDSTSPTPDCKVAIYKVVVLPPPCNVGTTAPKIN